VAQGLFKSGEGWAEESSMGKGHKVSSSSTAKHSVGVMLTLGANVKFPKFRSRHVVALENDGIVMANGYSGGSESNTATGITELANGQEWLCCKLGNNMAMASSSGEAREVKVCLVGLMHDNTGWGVYGNRVSSGAFVANGSGSGEKVCHAPRVGNGIERSGRRTGGMGTML